MRINISGARPEHTISGLEVNLDDGANGLLRAVSERLHTAPEQVRLIHMGRLIDGSRPLNSFLNEGTTVHVVVSPPRPPSGGSGSTSASFVQEGPFPNAFVDSFASMVPDVQVSSFGFLQDLTPGLLTLARSMVPHIVAGEQTSDRNRQSPQQQQQQQASQDHQSSASEQQQPQNEQQPQQPARTQHRQTFHRITFTPAAPPPPPLPTETPNTVPLHVHVHVSLNELDELPERLERLRSRIRLSGWNIHTHVEQGQEAPPPSQSATTRPPETAGGASPVTGDAEGISVTRGEPQTTEGSSRIVSEMVNQIIGAFGNNADSEGAPQTLAEMASQLIGESNVRGVENNEESERGLLWAGVWSTIVGNEALANIMRLVLGDWSAIPGFRPRLVEALNMGLRGPEQVAVLTNRMPVDRAVEEANAILGFLRESTENMQAIERELRPGVDFFSDLRRLLITLHRELVHAILDETLDDGLWMRKLRTVFVRIFGIAMERSSTWFVRGSAGLLTLLSRVMVNVSQSLQINNTPAVVQGRMFLELGLPRLLQGWHEEYQSSHRQESDANIFEHAPAEAAAAAAAEVQGDDDLLDDCLEEFCADGHGARAPTTESDSFREALRSFGALPDDVSENIWRRAQRFRHETPPADTGEKSNMWKHLGKR